MFRVILFLCLTAFVNESKGLNVNQVYFPQVNRHLNNPVSSLNRYQRLNQNLNRLHENLQAVFHKLSSTHHKFHRIIRPQIFHSSHKNPWFSKRIQKLPGFTLFPTPIPELNHVLHRYSVFPYSVQWWKTDYSDQHPDNSDNIYKSEISTSPGINSPENQSVSSNMKNTSKDNVFSIQEKTTENEITDRESVHKNISEVTHSTTYDVNIPNISFPFDEVVVKISSNEIGINTRKQSELNSKTGTDHDKCSGKNNYSSNSQTIDAEIKYNTDIENSLKANVSFSKINRVGNFEENLTIESLKNEYSTENLMTSTLIYTDTSNTVATQSEIIDKNKLENLKEKNVIKDYVRGSPVPYDTMFVTEPTLFNYVTNNLDSTVIPEYTYKNNFDYLSSSLLTEINNKENQFGTPKTEFSTMSDNSGDIRIGYSSRTTLHTDLNDFDYFESTTEGKTFEDFVKSSERLTTVNDNSTEYFVKSKELYTNNDKDVVNINSEKMSVFNSSYTTESNYAENVQELSTATEFIKKKVELEELVVKHTASDAKNSTYNDGISKDIYNFTTVPNVIKPNEESDINGSRSVTEWVVHNDNDFNILKSTTEKFLEIIPTVIVSDEVLKSDKKNTLGTQSENPSARNLTEENRGYRNLTVNQTDKKIPGVIISIKNIEHNLKRDNTESDATRKLITGEANPKPIKSNTVGNKSKILEHTSLPEKDFRLSTELNDPEYSNKQAHSFQYEPIDDRIIISYDISNEDFSKTKNTHATTNDYLYFTNIDTSYSREMYENVTDNIEKINGSHRNESNSTTSNDNLLKSNGNFISELSKEEALSFTQKKNPDKIDESINKDNSLISQLQNKTHKNNINESVKDALRVEEKIIHNLATSVATGVDSFNINGSSFLKYPTELTKVNNKTKNQPNELDSSTNTGPLKSSKIKPSNGSINGIVSEKTENLKSNMENIGEHDSDLHVAHNLQAIGLNKVEQHNLKSLGVFNTSNETKASLFQFDLLNQSNHESYAFQDSNIENQYTIQYTTETNNPKIAATSVTHDINMIEHFTRTQEEFENLLFNTKEKEVEDQLKLNTSHSLLSPSKLPEILSIEKDWYDDSIDMLHKTEKKNLIREINSSSINLEENNIKILPKDSIMKMLTDYTYEDPFGDYYESITDVNNDDRNRKGFLKDPDVYVKNITRKIIRRRRNNKANTVLSYLKGNNVFYDICFVNINKIERVKYEQYITKMFMTCKNNLCCIKNITNNEIKKNRIFETLLNFKKAFLKNTTKTDNRSTDIYLNRLNQNLLTDRTLLTDGTEKDIFKNNNFSNQLFDQKLFYNSNKEERVLIRKHGKFLRNVNRNIDEVVAVIKILLTGRKSDYKRKNDSISTETRKKRHLTNFNTEKQTSDNTSLKQSDAAAILALLKQDTDGAVQGDDAYAGDDQYSYEYDYDDKLIDSNVDHGDVKELENDYYDDGSSILELISTNITHKSVNHHGIS